MSNEPKPEGRIPELNALIEKRVGKEILAKFGDGAAEDIAAAGAAARERVSNLLDPESWKNAPIYQSPLRDADGNEVFVTIFLDGRIKRIVPAGPQTLVPWVEPESDLPVDARERLKAMKDHDLRTLMEWFDGSPHFTDLLAYAKAVVTSRVPLERRITCSRCGALYGAWTKNDSSGTTATNSWTDGLRSSSAPARWTTASRCPTGSSCARSALRRRRNWPKRRSCVRRPSASSRSSASGKTDDAADRFPVRRSRRIRPRL